METKKFKVWIAHRGQPAETRLIEALSHEEAAETWARLHDESRHTRLEIASHKSFPVVHVLRDGDEEAAAEQWRVSGDIKVTYWASEPEDPPP